MEGCRWALSKIGVSPKTSDKKSKKHQAKASLLQKVSTPIALPARRGQAVPATNHQNPATWVAISLIFGPKINEISCNLRQFFLQLAAIFPATCGNFSCNLRHFFLQLAAIFLQVAADIY